MKQPRLLDKISTDNKVIALTFDDGPDGDNILDLLHILDGNNIKCTFFLTGRVVETFPDYSNMIIQQGHEIGNHSYSHTKLDQLSKDSIKAEIIKTEKAMTNILGVDPKPLFKSPYNVYNKNILDVLGNLGYNYVVSASTITADFSGDSVEDTSAKIINSVKPGAILLMHISRSSHAIEALPLIIKGIENIGYRLTTVSELISLEQKSARPPIKYGSSGETVRELQKQLNKLGYDPCPIDGIFGPLTEIAVRTFQFDESLVVDGIVKDNTWTAIEKKLNTLNKDSKNSNRGLLTKKESSEMRNNGITRKTMISKVFDFLGSLKSGDHPD